MRAAAGADQIWQGMEDMRNAVSLQEPLCWHMHHESWCILGAKILHRSKNLQHSTSAVLGTLQIMTNLLAAPGGGAGELGAHAVRRGDGPAARTGTRTRQPHSGGPRQELSRLLPVLLLPLQVQHPCPPSFLVMPILLLCVQVQQPLP